MFRCCVAFLKRLIDLWQCGKLRAVQDRIQPLAAFEFERISDEAGQLPILVGQSDQSHNFDEHPIYDGWIKLNPQFC